MVMEHSTNHIRFNNMTTDQASLTVEVDLTAVRS